MPTYGTPHAVALDTARLRRLLGAAGDTPSSARQDHGFVFQDGAAHLLGLWVPEGYTAKWDAYSRDPRAGSAAAYSFKNVNIDNNIELGSLKRQASVDCDFYLCVGLWSSEKLNIRRIHVMRIEADYWRSLWPHDVTPFLEEEVFDGIGNSHQDDPAWTTRRRDLHARWREALPAGSPMKWHPKRDHKKQRRVQCSISRDGFNELFQLTYDAEATGQLEAALDT